MNFLVLQFGTRTGGLLSILRCLLGACIELECGVEITRLLLDSLQQHVQEIISWRISLEGCFRLEGCLVSLVTGARRKTGHSSSACLATLVSVIFTQLTPIVGAVVLTLLLLADTSSSSQGEGR